MLLLQWVHRRLVAKTAALVALVTIALLLPMILFGRGLIQERFAFLEREEAKRRMQVVTSQLDNEIDQLRGVSLEFGRRDGNRQILEAHDPVSVAKSLPVALFREQRLNMLVLVDGQGRLVHSQCYDQTKGGAVASNEAVLQAIGNTPSLIRFPEDAKNKKGTSGILLTTKIPWLIASSPIRSSQDHGTSIGRVLVGRLLDQEMLRRLSLLSDQPLRIEPIPPDSPCSTGVAVTIIDTQHLLATAVLKDLNGQHALRLALTLPRPLAQEGERLWQYIVVAACLFSAAMLLALMVILHHCVHRRLIRMTRDVTAIDAPAQTPAAIAAPGQDELACLGRAINKRLVGPHAPNREQNIADQSMQRMLDTMQCGVVVVDVLTRRVVIVNKASARILNRTPEEMIDHTCHASICTSECNQCPVLDLHETMDLRERVMVSGDGSLIPVLKSATVLDIKQRSVLVESFVDITPFKQAEAKLRASESRYRQFFEQDLTGDFIVTLSGEIVDCNMAFARMLGYDEVETVKQINIVDHYLCARTREKMIERVRREGKVERYALELKRKDGSPLYCIANEIGEYDELGELVRLRGYFFDETKRVLMEREIRQSQKLEAIGTLASGIAHDFNNILAGIIGYADLLLMREEGEGRRKEYLENILTASEKARKLIHQILAFSKSTDEAALQPLELAPVIREVLELLRATLPTTIAIEERLIERCWVLADPVQVHQIVLNLATNAGHAMREHGGTLSVHLTRMAPGAGSANAAAGSSAGSFACLKVHDTGHGIAEEIRHRIFEPFFSTKGKNEGTGLGLSVVQGIVQNLGGSIQLASTVGQGTSFTILLPLTEESDIKAPSVAPSLARGQEHIAYVDDDSFLVEIGKEILLSLGYQVRTFTESQKALEYICAHAQEVDLVVSDMTMPQLTGIGLARGLRAAGVLTPMIIYTGYVEDLAGEDLAALGIQEVLLKPITPQILAGKVRTVLDRQRPPEPTKPHSPSISPTTSADGHRSGVSGFNGDGVHLSHGENAV